MPEKCLEGIVSLYPIVVSPLFGGGFRMTTMEIADALNHLQWEALRLRDTVLA